jgi:hypothetical protein
MPPKKCLLKCRANLSRPSGAKTGSTILRMGVEGVWEPRVVSLVSQGFPHTLLVLLR